MKKTILALLIVLALCFGCCAYADDSLTSGDYTYKVLEDGTAAITKYEGSAAALTIPAELDGHAVSAIEYGAFSSHNELTSVIIPEGVTEIGDRAFLGCGSMTSISIPSTVTVIGTNPFMDCFELTEITIAEESTALAVVDGVLFSTEDAKLVCYPQSKYDLTTYTVPEGTLIIGNCAFASDKQLTQVILPSTLTEIKPFAFSYCSHLAGIVIPEGVTVVGETAFGGCKDLTSVTIPASLAIIEPYTFRACKKLTEVTIPEGVTSIGRYAFEECEALETVALPASLTEIDENAFMIQRSMGSTDPVPLTCAFTAPEGSAALQFCTENGLTCN